jgi:hypothetical protein
MCFDFLYNFGLKNFSFSEEMSWIWSSMYNGLHVKYPFSLLHFKEDWIFSTDFSKMSQISNFMKIRPVGAELFHADGWTDRHHNEASSRFSQLCERAWKGLDLK